MEKLLCIFQSLMAIMSELYCTGALKMAGHTSVKRDGRVMLSCFENSQRVREHFKFYLHVCVCVVSM